MRRFNIKHICGAAAGALLLWSCAEDSLDMPGTGPARAGESTSLVINLLVPQGNTPDDVKAARSRSENPDPFMDLEGNEGTITELRLLAYVNDPQASLSIDERLDIPADIPQSPDKKAVYTIDDIADGEYHIYLLANLDGALEGKDYATEQKLKEVLMTYSATQLPAPGRLPMVYEPEQWLNIGGDAPEEILCSLTIAAVKVRYAIIFDKNVQEHPDFGDGGLRITGLSLSGLASTAPVVKNTAHRAATLFGLSGQAVPFGYFAGTGYYNEANYNQSNLDMVDRSKLSALSQPDYTGDWVATGTVYLPESYVSADGDTPVSMKIDAELVGADNSAVTGTTTYTIEHIGDYKGNTAGDYSLHRGTYYEVAAKIQSLGQPVLNATVAAKDWAEEVLPVDFVHTYLTVDKTEVTVTSVDAAEIVYETDGRGGVRFECETVLTDARLPIITALAETRESDGKTVLRIKVNDDININALDADQLDSGGEPVTCWIIAGNIRKQIKVNYDIKPYFTITPASLTFKWDGSQSLPEQEFAYETNLGGLTFLSCDAQGNVKGDITSALEGDGTTNSVTVSRTRDGGAVEDVQSTISLKCSNTSAADGRIKVSVPADPGVVAHHYFIARGRSAYNGTYYADTVEVSVIPSQGDYRIYFRAINDYQRHTFTEPTKDNWYVSNLAFLDGDYANWPAESEGEYEKGNNWTDWWNLNPDSYTSNTGKTVADTIAAYSHHIYVYGQNGETTTGQSGTSWHFSGRESDGGWYFTSPTMQGDTRNPGWYFYDLEAGKQAYDDASKRVEPGTTLLIFYAHKDQNGADWGTGGLGFEGHRCSHHNDPGVSLFNYEDREGWYLYDPTREPYYKVYDEKPVIEDVTYVVYTKSPVTGWWRTYGIAEGKTVYEDHRELTIWYNMKAGESAKVSGTDWYKTEIKLKAPRGDYGKNIRLNIETTTTTTKTETITNYVVCGVYERWWRSWGDWGYSGSAPSSWISSTPYAYFVDANGNQVGNNWPGYPMELLSSGSGPNDYWVEVPAGAENGCVIFNTTFNNNGQQLSFQLPQGVGFPNIDSHGGLPLSGKMGYVNYTNNWNDNWQKYGGGAPTKQVTVTETSKEQPVLFGGQSYSIDGSGRVYGYYENSKWHQGKPSGVN